MCCISTRFEPASWPRFSLLGLTFPIFLVLDLCFIAAWLVVRWRWAWIPLATIIPCLGYVLDYYPVSFRSKVPEGSIKVVTWNTNGYGAHCEDKEEARILTCEYLKNSGADIICMQESSIWGVVIEGFSNYMDSVGYQSDRHGGTVIFSKFPILDSDTLHYDTHRTNGVSGNTSKWYKLLMGKDTILLVNNHLESNHLEPAVKEKYVEQLDKPEIDQIKESGHTIGSLLVRSVAFRGQQADSLVALTERFKGMPIIMCGDFNDTPISYAYQRVNKVMKSAFRESGNGIGISYNQRGFWVRIDHIFTSEHWQTYNTSIDNSILTSDHYPLVSWLKLK